MMREKLSLFLLGLVLLLPSINVNAQQNPTLLGAGSDPCVTNGNNACNSTDVVQALMMTQDVLIYGVACLLFFLGFWVGMGMMLGAIRRQE